MKYYFEHIKDGQISEGYTAINIANHEAEIVNDDPDSILVARKNNGVPTERPKWEERFRPPSQPTWGFFWLTDPTDLESLSNSDIGEGRFEIGIFLDRDTLADVVYNHLPHISRGYLSVERIDRPILLFRLNGGRWGFLGELQLSKRGNATILSLDYVPFPTADELFPVKMVGESNLFRYGKRKHRGEVIRRLFDSLRQDPIWQSKLFAEAAMSRAEGAVRLNISVNTEVVRTLLIAAFDDTDLMILCFDRFYPIYNEKFGAGMSKGEKVQLLLAYCVRHGQLEALLKLIEERNPYQYNIYADRIFTT